MESASSSKTKARLWGILALFLLLVLLMTVFSSNIESFLYPVITVGPVSTDSKYLTAVETATAVLSFDKSVTVPSPEKGMNINLSVQEGGYVSTGDVLGTFLRDDHTLFDVLAPLDGQIMEIYVKTNVDMMPGEPLFLIIPSDSDINAVFRIDGDRVKQFGGTFYSATVYQNGIMDPDKTYPIEQSRYDPEDGTYVYSLKLPQGVGYSVDSTAVVTFEMVIKSTLGKPIVSKDMVFDLSAGDHPTANLYLVEKEKTLFGEKTRVRAIPITIEGSNACLYSFTTSAKVNRGNFVASTTKPLYDGAYVRILAEEDEE